MREGVRAMLTAAGLRRMLGIALCVALMAVRAGAVLIDTDDGSGNVSAPPAVGEEITMVGNGWNRQADLTGWDVVQQGQIWVWTEVVSALSGDVWGYKPSGSRALRWGRNEVSDNGFQETLNGLTSEAFESEFDHSTWPDHVAHESVVVNGDSGGAVFLKRGGQWELVGVLFSRIIFAGQLDSGNKAVFGNKSDAVDVDFYRNQIEAATAPIQDIPALPTSAAALLGGALLLFGARAARHSARGRVVRGG